MIPNENILLPYRPRTCVDKGIPGVGSGVQAYVWERSEFHTRFRPQPESPDLGQKMLQPCLENVAIGLFLRQQLPKNKDLKGLKIFRNENVLLLNRP